MSKDSLLSVLYLGVRTQNRGRRGRQCKVMEVLKIFTLKQATELGKIEECTIQFKEWFLLLLNTVSSIWAHLIISIK